MWLRNCWQVIAFAREIGERRWRERSAARRSCCFAPSPARPPRSPTAARTASRRCRSAASAGEQIQCGYHGMCFDAEGHCVRVPGQDTVPRQAKVRSYPLVERHAFAWIWLGDAALADPAKDSRRALVRSSSLGGVRRLSPLRRQLPARQRQPARPLARELRARGHDRQRGGGGSAVHRQSRRRPRAHAPRHVRHGSAAVLQAHHRLHRPHRPLAHQHVLAAGPAHHRERLDAGGLEGQERRARAQGAQFHHAGDDHHDALFLGDRAPVQDRRSGADRLHPRRHRQDLRPGQDGAGGAAAHHRRRSRPRGVPGVDPGRRGADPGPQAVGVDDRARNRHGGAARPAHQPPPG